MCTNQATYMLSVWFHLHHFISFPLQHNNIHKFSSLKQHTFISSLFPWLGSCVLCSGSQKTSFKVLTRAGAPSQAHEAWSPITGPGSSAWSPITGLGSPFRPMWLLVELVSFQLQGHENLLPQGQEEKEAPTSSQGLTCLPQSYPRCLLFY